MIRNGEIFALDSANPDTDTNLLLIEVEDE